MTDERLVALARNGAEEAFRELYERYHIPLFRFVWRLTGSTPTAEDLVHDCFLSLLRSPARFEPGRASLRTYLYAAIRNLARKHLRDEPTPEPVPDLEDDAPDCLDTLIREEAAHRIAATVAALPLASREVLLLAEYEELGMAEIAEITGDTTGAVRVRLHRARQALRRALAPEKENHHG